MLRTATALITYNKQILMLHRDNIPSIHNPNMWGPIGGGVEDNETFEEGIRREIKEETNLNPKNIKFLGKLMRPNQEIYAYIVRLEKDELKDLRLGDEGQELRFFSYEELSTLPVGNVMKDFLTKFGATVKQLIEGNKMPQKREGLECGHCGWWTLTTKFIGTHNRNHCPHCLWSKHVDLEKAGDRKALCGAGMEPVGLTFKRVGADKYGKPRQGELMVVHCCTNKKCGKISINRIAADDDPKTILVVFEQSKTMNATLRETIAEKGINLLTEKDANAVQIQLFGKS